LHLYDETLAVFADAVQVEDGFTVCFRVAKLLRARVCEVFYLVFDWQHLVQKVNQEVFVRLGAEQVF
jgi:hypothetical protein